MTFVRSSFFRLAIIACGVAAAAYAAPSLPMGAALNAVRNATPAPAIGLRLAMLPPDDAPAWEEMTIGEARQLVPSMLAPGGTKVIVRDAMQGERRAICGTAVVFPAGSNIGYVREFILTRDTVITRLLVNYGRQRFADEWKRLCAKPFSVGPDWHHRS